MIETFEVIVDVYHYPRRFLPYCNGAPALSGNKRNLDQASLQFAMERGRAGSREVLNVPQGEGQSVEI